jgi:hypothetical protein
MRHKCFDPVLSQGTLKTTPSHPRTPPAPFDKSPHFGPERSSDAPSLAAPEEAAAYAGFKLAALAPPLIAPAYAPDTAPPTPLPTAPSPRHAAPAPARM